MITESSIEIAASAPTVWQVYTDVERWSDWTASIESIVPLDEGGIEVGQRFRIKQPRFPTLVWQVTEVAPGTRWTWRQRSFGSTALAAHEVIATAPDRTVVRQRIQQRGPVGFVSGVLTKRLTKRYLHLEGEGLKARSEARRADATAT